MSSHNIPRTPRPRTVRGRRGFTLLEILVVVMIIALLAALVTPRVWQHLGTSRVRVAEARAAQVATELRLYLADHGMTRVPGNFDLQVLVDAGRLRQKDLLDPWNNPFVLVAPGQENPDFDIVSFGADGQVGGEGQDADIVH
jgi:general secretion pathway protein G